MPLLHFNLKTTPETAGSAEIELPGFAIVETVAVVEMPLWMKFMALFAAIKDNAEIKALKMSLKFMCEEQYRVTNEVLRAMIEG